MADKVIVLKDPFTGDRLFPVCSSKSIIDESGNPFDLSKYLTKETASTLYAAKTHTHEIANINGLQTELDNLKTSVSEGKSLIAAAVTDKGVQTAADATFQQMATNIGNIQTGNCISGAASNITTESKFDDQRYNYLVITISNPLITTNFNRALIVFNVKNLNLQEQQGCLFYSTNKSSYVYEYGDGRSSYNATFTASIGTGKIIFTSNKVYSASGGNPFFPSVYSPYMWFAYKV